MKKLIGVFILCLLIGWGCKQPSKSKLEARAKKQLKELRADWPDLFKDTIVKWKFDTVVQWKFDTIIKEKVVQGETKLIMDTARMEELEAQYYKKAIDLYLSRPLSEKDSLDFEAVKDSIVRELIKERRKNDNLFGKVWLDPVTKDTLGISLRIWAENGKVKYTLKTDPLHIHKQGDISITKDGETKIDFAKCPEYHYYDFPQFWVVAGLALLFFILAFYLGVRSRK